MTRHVLGSADTYLKSGEMKRLDLDGNAVVIARTEDGYHAFQANCTHYGGDLDQGLLNGHTIMCPLHHACFDIRTGRHTEPPALNDLPVYAVSIDGNQVVVTLDTLPVPSPQPPATTVAQIVIVG